MVHQHNAGAVRDGAHPARPRLSKERHFWPQYIGYSSADQHAGRGGFGPETEQMDKFVTWRRDNAALYTSLLRDVPGLKKPTPVEEPWAQNVLLDVRASCSKTNSVSAATSCGGAGGAGHRDADFFIPMHLQPIYYADYKGERYPWPRTCAGGACTCRRHRR